MMVNVPRQLITGSTPIDWYTCGPALSGPSTAVSPSSLNISGFAPVLKAEPRGLPATPLANGRIDRPFITSLRFMIRFFIGLINKLKILLEFLKDQKKYIYLK